MTKRKDPNFTTARFTHAEGQIHPEQLIYALEGICAALDMQQPTLGNAADLDVMGNLTLAAQILASQLAGRLA
jgi:hypothetical protein